MAAVLCIVGVVRDFACATLEIWQIWKLAFTGTGVVCASQCANRVCEEAAERMCKLHLGCCAPGTLQG